MDSRDNQSFALLSARSYLEPQLVRPTQVTPTQQRSSSSTDIRKDDANTMATTDIRHDPETPEVEAPRTHQPRPVRKRGRPRMDAPGAAVLSLDRRAQIRQAQKTYRLKKEATLESCKARVAELEGRLQRVAELLSESNESDTCKDLDTTNPAIARILRGMRELLAPEIEDIRRALTERGHGISSDDPHRRTSGKTNDSHILSPALVFGYQALGKSAAKSFDKAPAPENARSRLSPARRRSSPGHIGNEGWDRRPFPGLRHTERLFGGSTPITYSSHETLFSRRVQRFSLEHAYRLFTDARSDPALIYRVFRLVPCIQDKAKMAPYFHKLVHAGIEDRLEIPTLPFYCVGGAGMHYPLKDPAGHPTYPSNMRMPRRLLGILPTERTFLGDPQSHLKLLGFDGEWFDCHDVQGYLEDKGVVLDRSSVLAEIHTPRHQPTASPNPSQFVLDLEIFLAKALLNGLAILGRAPGFKRLDVEAAFKSAMRVQV